MGRQQPAVSAVFRFDDRPGMSWELGTYSTVLPLHYPHSSRLHSVFLSPFSISSRQDTFSSRVHSIFPTVLVSNRTHGSSSHPLGFTPGRSTSPELPRTFCALPDALRNGLRPGSSPAVPSASLPAMRFWTAGRYAMVRKHGRQGYFFRGVTV